MVVRAVLSAVVKTLPYSDRLPTVLSNVLEPELVPVEAPQSESTPESSPESPRGKIHNKLIYNRIASPPIASGSAMFGDGLHKVDEMDEIEYELRQRKRVQRERPVEDDDLTVNDFSYCDTCDIIPGVNRTSINKLGEKHSRTSSSGLTRVAFVDAPATLDALPELTPLLIQENLSEEKQRDLRVKQYLNDQNQKFDALINNNIEDFFKQQDGFDETVDPDASRGLLTRIVYGGAREVMAHIPYVKNKLETDVRLDISGSYSDNVSATEIPLSKSSSPIPTTAFAPSRNAAEVPTPRNKAQSEKFGPSNHELLLDSLDVESKLKLYHLLRTELQIKERPSLDDPFIFDHPPKDSELALDKLQSFLIISIKLLVAGVKLIIPVCKYLYIKFQNNQMFFFNRKNMARIFNIMMWFMRGLESKLQDNGEFIDRVYNHEFTFEDPELNEEELTVVGSLARLQLDSKKSLDLLLHKAFDKATFMIDKKIQRSLATETNNTWKRAALEYAWTNYLHTGKENHNYMEDPRYAIYFSNRNMSKDNMLSNSPSNSVSNASNSSPSNAASNGSNTSSVLGTPAMSRSNSFGSNPQSASTDSFQELSMFRIAERFVDDLG